MKPAAGVVELEIPIGIHLMLKVTPLPLITEEKTQEERTQQEQDQAIQEEDRKLENL